MIGFNKPHICGNELAYIKGAVAREKLSGNGYYTQKCQQFLEHRYGIKKVLLTTSCTDALEMAALLLNVGPGDEVIIPSFTFVSTANAFVLRGAKIVFIDSSSENPNLDVDLLEPLITSRTKAIVVVHYAGICCDMDRVMSIAHKHGLFVVEDAAQAIDSTTKGRALGSIGHLGAFSFHETKNVSAGEGGALLINDESFSKRAEIIWEKGTNRSAFFRGEVDRYGWIDVGSSFLPSEITAAFLFAQLECIDQIQRRRQMIWTVYFDQLKPLADKGLLTLPKIPPHCSHNAHIFYLVCVTSAERDNLLDHLNKSGVNAISHYHSLHKSAFYSAKHKGPDLPECDRYASTLLRLPLYFELNSDEIFFVAKTILDFYGKG